ncbi:terpene synthase-like [Hylaeus anthracinus]|uniref:terpene synthase-like n=1 Tax=Hylaeus anthracinus TaxID=313031 RepID=UPI0023B8D500|nr:terpene synthase-like [Hylaeus anthracinus]
MEQNKKILHSIRGDEEEDQILLEPFSTIYKVLRKECFVLPYAFNHWLNVPKDKLDAIIEIGDIFYHFWLVTEDIQDSADFREGFPTSHTIFGTAGAMNSSTYGLLIAFEKVLALNHPKGPQVFTDSLLKTSRGQGMGLYWKHNNICPSKSAYTKAVIGKSAQVLQCVIDLMQLFSDCKKDFTYLTQTFGYYFQIRKDYFDFLEKDNKTFAGDLSEGEFSFPTIHAIQSHPEDTRVIEMLRKRVKDIDLKRDCVKLLNQFGSFSHTKSVLEDLDKELRDEIKRLGGNPLLEKFLDSLLDWKTKNVP